MKPSLKTRLAKAEQLALSRPECQTCRTCGQGIPDAPAEPFDLPGDEVALDIGRRVEGRWRALSLSPCPSCGQWAWPNGRGAPDAVLRDPEARRLHSELLERIAAAGSRGHAVAVTLADPEACGLAFDLVDRLHGAHKAEGPR